ncbi:GntR family transcriptional regulator [Subtercola endophyticus]|uniref:GntR family transcriptional regulator n=1 Tax=Subtercola endophyticus TaxID=2895559 RepID=UPI001E2FF3B1|nr:GntR family transcriptional regulator [Subtercola endophyticus]UFS60951.1 GntR family transcriptional regulator [Subtercola endophyticus]
MVEISQTVQIYARLREGILSLSMAPGERLTERGLETELLASRTPVRAALMRLESEGLVQREGRGWMVAPIDLAEIAHLLEYREVIESAGVRLACERAVDADIEALDELLASFDISQSSEEGLRSGTDFHVELMRLSQNPFLVTATEGSMTRLSRTRWLEVQTEQSRALAVSEHRAIVDALRHRDADVAVRRVVAHIHDTRDRLLAAIDSDRRMLRARGVAIV